MIVELFSTLRIRYRDILSAKPADLTSICTCFVVCAKNTAAWPVEKIVAMKIGIIELLALHDAVNDTAEIYNLPIPVASFQVFDDIRDYKKMGGFKKQLERLSAQLYIAKQVCSNQYQAMTALANLQSYGITEDHILNLNDFLLKRNM